MRKSRVLGVGLVICMAIVMASTLAFAAKTYNVKANYGVRVNEGGTCELIGEVKLEPTVPSNSWEVGTLITVEFLAGAKLCQPVKYVYDSNVAVDDEVGLGKYTVVGAVGATRLTIKVEKRVQGLIRFGQIVIGQKSEVCLNIKNTPYKESDPNYQLVQASYKDNKGGAYSGDTYVATVKKLGGHTTSLCPKDEYSLQIPYNKEGSPIVPLCFSSSGQEQTPCGLVLHPKYLCVKIADSDTEGTQFAAGALYHFTYQVEKIAGVGLRAVQIAETAANLQQNLAYNYKYFDESNKEVVIATDADYLKVQKITFDVTLNKSGDLFMRVFYAYDTCTAKVGSQSVGKLGFMRDPCGDSFEGKIKPVVFVSCGEVSDVVRVFPYGPRLDTDWWATLSLSNPNSVAMNVTIEFFEKNGAKYVATVTIPALGMYSSQIKLIPVAGNGSDPAFGDSPFWAQVKGPMNFTGFMVFGNARGCTAYVATEF